MTIYRGAGGSGDATNDATVTAVAAYAAQAATSATNASGSATSSSTSATNAASSASQAASSATNTASSASQAASSQSAAATSATQAANSATTAGTQATTATNAANSASSSASTATSAASSAASSASAASTSASNAATSATNAANSASSALAIYGNTAAMNAAVTTATNASNSAASSASTATTAATNAAQSAASSQTSATTAQSAAANASAIYGSTAALQAAVTSAQNSATASSASSSTAQTAANTATTQATNASNSATQAAASAASAAAITLGVASNRASIRPSLLLDFANTRQLDPRVTFQRASTGKFYDGTSVVKAEENLLTYSQEFDNAAWSAAATAISRTANATTAPDGTNTASAATGNGTASTHYFGHNFGYVSTATYTFSVYVKANGVNYIQLILSGGSGYANFDVSNGAGVVGTYNAPFSSLAIQDVGSGWYRCSCLIVNNSSNNIYICLSNAANKTRSDVSFTTSGGVYIWGAQLEQRATLTAYTPTTTSAITNYIPVLQTALANQPRFDVDPVTGESKGLLIEEQRTNLLTYSEQFDSSTWTKARTSISANVVVAPDGTLTADKLVEDTTASNSHILISPTATIASSVCTGTCYMKAAERSWAVLSIGNTTSGLAYFDLVNGVTGTVTSGFTASITAVGNGWYRCSVSGTIATSNQAPFSIYMATANNVFSYTGNGYSGLYIWGAQLEAGSFATSYIPTVASQVTRSADSASMTGSNFSSWYRADEGTVYAVHSAPVAANRDLLAINDGTGNNSIELYALSTSAIKAYINNKNALQMDVTVGSPVTGTNQSSLFYKLNDSGGSLNGAAVVADTSCVVPTVDRLTIGYYATGFNFWNGTIKRIAYYPKRLSNTELQGITNNS